jgi:hypothetical protein
LLRWFATYDVVWLPQEVRVDCKKIIVVWVAEKITKYILFRFFAKKKKKCLIDVDCTQKSSCWLQLGCQFWVATWLKKTYGWLFSPHRMQTCLVCLSQGRDRSLIQ